MRPSSLILVSLLLGGCSWNILMSGKHKEVLTHIGTPRSAVIAELGAPYSSKILTDLLPRPPLPKGVTRSRVRSRVDTYYTKEVIPDWTRAGSAGEAAGMTMGVSELVLAPSALGHFIPRQKRLIIGYDSKDRVSSVYIENASRREP